MALAPLSQTIFLTEDGSVVLNQKAVTIPPLVAVPPVTLGALSLSGALTAGTPSSGSINGATADSMITTAVAGLTVDSPTRTYAWDGSGQPGTTANGLTETHWNATNNGRTSPVTIAAAPATGTFTMAQLAESRSFQRTTTAGGTEGKGTGRIAVPLTVTKEGPVYARQRKADGTIIGSPWLAIANQATTNGRQNIVIPGVSAVASLFRLDLASSPTGPWQQGTVLVGMTDIDAMVGQSLQVANTIAAYDNTTMAALGVTIDPQTRIRHTLVLDVATHSDANVRWEAPSDTGLYTSAFMGEFGRLIAAAQGMPAAIVGHAQGAQGLGSFYGSGPNAAAFALALDKAGGFARLRINCAHTDAANGQTYEQRKASLSAMRAFAAEHNAALGNDFTIYLQSYGNVFSAGWGEPQQRQMMRRADFDWCADPANRAIYVGVIDQDLADIVHQAQSGSVTFARAEYRATRPALGLAHDNRGAQFLTGTRQGKQIRLPISYLNGGTTITASGTNLAGRFKVFPRGDQTTLFELDATTPYSFDNSAFLINLTNDPGPNVPLDFYFGYPWYDRSGCFYDNVTDGDGITRGRHIQASITPVAIPAPSGGSGFAFVGDVSSSEGNPSNFAFVSDQSNPEGNP